MARVLSVIMGGGQGSRLRPLTHQRCKPAVPLAGKYRLVDIPISNCLNGGFNKIFVLTQFNTASLHHHIQETYKFDPFGGGFVDILSAEQTERGQDWYQGTCDAVRQNLHHFHAEDDDLFLILSGDQLYRLDLRAIVEQHRRTSANVTIAAKAMPANDVSGLGVMKVRDDLSVSEFVEKPKDPKVVEQLVLSDRLRARVSDPSDTRYCLASMGIYVFNKRTLYNALTGSTATDFGKEIIPSLLGKIGMYAYMFDGYWEDIGTVRSFFEANLRLADPLPPFNFFEPERPIFTRARYLPATKINRCSIDHAILADGCIINDATVKRSVIGVRSQIASGSVLENVVMMGSDTFEDAQMQMRNADRQLPNLGVGKNCVIRNAIIDKNARIGNNVRLDPEGKGPTDDDGFAKGYEKGDIQIRDGVLIVNKNTVIPDETVI